MKRRLAFIVIPLLILLIALAGGFDLLWRFFVFLVAMLLLSYLWTHLSIRGVYGQAESSTSLCQVGQSFDEDFSVENRGRIPMPILRVREATDLPGYRNELGISLGGHGSHRWHRRVYCRRRGRYRIGALNFRTTDPFGFFSAERRIDRNQEILVYPATLELPLFQLSPQPEAGTGSRRWLATTAGPNASRVREYVSGDSLRHIHWHSTAHTGNLMVKEFDPDRSRDTTLREIWIVLDMNRNPQLGEGDETTEEYGVTIAASLAKKYLDDGKLVGLIAEGDTSCLIPPGAGEAHLQAILHSLTVLKATGDTPIDKLLAASAERFEAGAAVIVIMPSVNPPIAPSLGLIRSRQVRTVAILLDSFSFGGATSPANNPRSLGAAGCDFYTVRQGMEIGPALDSRRLASPKVYTGGRLQP
jgi:uncharacterized protein (DUF58 family)